VVFRVWERAVVPVLFEHTLVPHKWAVKNPDLSATDAHTEVESPPSTSELTLALRVLEGCCLLDTASQTIASQYSAVSVCKHTHTHTLSLSLSPIV
jgi:hypothetical protein